MLNLFTILKNKHVNFISKLFKHSIIYVLHYIKIKIGIKCNIVWYKISLYFQQNTISCVSRHEYRQCNLRYCSVIILQLLVVQTKSFRVSNKFNLCINCLYYRYIARVLYRILSSRSCSIPARFH